MDITDESLLLKTWPDNSTMDELAAEWLANFHFAHNAVGRFDSLLGDESIPLLDRYINLWKDPFSAECSSEIFAAAAGFFGYEDLLCRMAELYWNDSVPIARQAVNTEYFHHIKRKNKQLTIGLYYRRLYGGGAERVTSRLAGILANRKDEYGNEEYKVILITDDCIQEEEYPVSGPVCMEFLPDNRRCSGKNYRERFRAWTKILDKHDIDIVVSGQWMNPYTIWDMLAVKGHVSKPAFIMHIHSFTMRPYQFENNMALNLFYDYQIMDGAVVLSECDQSFLKQFCKNVSCITNPIDYLYLAIKSDVHESRENHSIIWTGRIEKYKHPMDLIYMMRIVAKEIPDARLYIVGTGNSGYVDKLKSETARLSLDENIIFTGYTLDVDFWYEKASVYVCTSEYEGYSLSIAEAFAHSIPVIVYDMPWLSFIRMRGGIRTVDMGRYDQMAREVIYLLEHSEEKTQMGLDGRNVLEKISEIDIGAEWEKVFDNIDPDDRPVYPSDDEQIRNKYLCLYQEDAKKSLRTKLDNAVKLKPLANFMTARIDVKNVGSGNNDINIIWTSDSIIDIGTPDWYTNDEGAGYVFKASKPLQNGYGKVGLKFGCICDGILNITLRGPNVNDENKNRIPVWVDYADFCVDDEVVFSDVKCICHDKPFKYKREVKHGDEILVSLSWKSHAEGKRAPSADADLLIKDLMSRNSQNEKENNKLKAELNKSNAEKNVLESSLKTSCEKSRTLESELDSLKASKSYRIGRAVTWPVRKFKEILR